MRSELREYRQVHPEQSGHHFTVLHMMRVRYWRRAFSAISLGSSAWHKMQQKVALLSATDEDCQIRSMFYEITMKDNCKGDFYCLQNVTMNFPERIYLGNNVFLNKNVNIVAREPITIGDDVLIGPNVIINSGSHNYSDPKRLIREQGHKKAPIIIADDVFIGANSVILPGVSIGRGSVVGAGAVVTKSIPALTVVGGVPARSIAKRG